MFLAHLSFTVLTGSQDLSEEILQKAMTTLERKVLYVIYTTPVAVRKLSHSKCYKNMLQAIKTDKALRIEFDESVVCDICRDVSAVTVATIHTHTDLTS